MRRKIKLRNKKIFSRKPKKSTFIIFLIFTFIFVIIITLNYVSSKSSPLLFDYAEIETKKLTSIIINDSVNKIMSNNLNVEELFLITKDSNNEIKTVDFNPLIVNQLLTKITSDIQTNIKYIEQGKIDKLSIPQEILDNYDHAKLKNGIIYEIPSGVVLGDSILSNLGPRLPVRLSLIGTITSYINTKVTNYGINNAMVEVNIIMEMYTHVILPFSREKIKIENSIPIAIKLIQGSVPNYYLNGLNTNSNAISLPIE